MNNCEFIKMGRLSEQLLIFDDILEKVKSGKYE